MSQICWARNRKRQSGRWVKSGSSRLCTSEAPWKRGSFWTSFSVSCSRRNLYCIFSERCRKRRRLRWGSDWWGWCRGLAKWCCHVCLTHLEIRHLSCHERYRIEIYRSQTCSRWFFSSRVARLDVREPREWTVATVWRCVWRQALKARWPSSTSAWVTSTGKWWISPA